MRTAIILVVIAALLCLLILLLMPSLGPHSDHYRWVECKNNLKQIALALHSYHDVYGTFPPAYVADASDQPAHSWRVLILPFIDSPSLELKDLYKRYRFDEPWDGPHNRTLHELIPAVYQCPSYQHREKVSDLAKQLTNYVVVDSPSSIFSQGRTTSIREITDGTSNTMLVAEVGRHAVHWLEPEDVSAHELLSDLRFAAESEDNVHRHRGGLNTAFADGSSRYLKSTLEADLLFGLVTKDGSEPTDDF